MGAPSVAWCKTILALFIIIAVVVIVVLAIAISRSKAVRDANTSMATGVAYGSSFIIAHNDSAVGVDLADTTIRAQAYSSGFTGLQVAQLYSQDPTKTVVQNKDKIRIYFPQVGVWYSNKNTKTSTTTSYDDATDVTVNIADVTNNTKLPNDGVGSATMVELYDTAADATNDNGYKVLSQGTWVQFVPAGVFGADGFAGP